MVFEQNYTKPEPLKRGNDRTRLWQSKFQHFVCSVIYVAGIYNILLNVLLNLFYCINIYSLKEQKKKLHEARLKALAGDDD